MKTMKFKIQKKDIVCLCITVATVIVSIVLSQKSVYIKICDYIPELAVLINFSLPILLAVLPIAIALATFIYQIFYNRYTLKDFKRSLRSEFFWLTSILSSELFCFFIFWITKEKIKFLYFEIIFLLVYSIVKFSIFILKYNKFSIEGYVEKYTKNSIAIFKSKEITVEKIKVQIRDINEYFTESLEKKENNYIRQIIESKHRIFRAYLKNISCLLLDKEITQEDDDSISTFLADSIIRDYKYLNDNNSSKKIMSIYTLNVIKTLKETITCNRFDLFKKIVDTFIKCFHYTNKNDFPLTYFIEIFEEVYEEQVSNEDREYNEYIEKEILHLFVSIIHESENTEIEQRLLLSNGHFLILASTKYSEEIFKSIFDDFISKIGFSLKYFNQKDSEILTGILVAITENVEEKNNVNNFNLLTLKLIELLETSFQYKNEKCLTYIGTLFISNLKSNLYTKENKVEEARFKILLKCIRVFPETSMIFLPDFKNLIEKNKRNLQEMKHIHKQFSSIFQALLNLNKFDVISFYFDYLNECIYVLNQEERECQSEFINLYEEILVRSIRSQGSTKFDIAMSNFEDLLENLDKDKKISEKLLGNIFNLFDRVGSSLLDTDYFALQSFFLDSLKELPNNLKAIKKQEQKERITEILFHLTIGTLESKNEKSLKICSNTIGWYAVLMEDKGDIDTYKATVDAAIHMYNLAVDQNYQKSTIAFIGTLFIVLGAYATAKRGITYAEYVKSKIDTLKDKETLKISRDLRYFEYKYWNSTFDGKAKDSISKFFANLSI